MWCLHVGVVVSTDTGSNPGWGLSVWSLHVLPVYAWDLSGYSSFLPLSKKMHVRLEFPLFTSVCHSSLFISLQIMR